MGSSEETEEKVINELDNEDNEEYEEGKEEDGKEEDGELNNNNNNDKNIDAKSAMIKDYSMKHPLGHRWTLWYDNPGRRLNVSSWADHLQKVTTFDTVCLI